MSDSNIINILFGVEGGADINSGSGKLIQTQLNEIAKKIKLKITIDEDNFSRQLNTLKTKIEKELGSLPIKIEESKLTSSTSTSKTVDEYERLKKLAEECIRLEVKKKKLNEESPEGLMTAEKLKEQKSEYAQLLQKLKDAKDVDLERIKAIEEYNKKLGEAINVSSKIPKSTDVKSDAGGGKADEKAKEIEIKTGKLLGLKSAAESYSATLSKMGKMSSNTVAYEKLNKVLVEQKFAYEEAKYAAREYTAKDDNGLPLDEEGGKIATYIEKLDKAAQFWDKYGTGVDLAKLKDKAQSLFTTNGFDKIIARSDEARQIAEDFSEKVSKLSLGEGFTKETVRELNQEFITAQASIKEIGRETDSLGSKIKRAFDEKFVQNFGAILVGLSVAQLRKVYKTVVELDSALTNLQIATGYTRAETAKLLKGYSSLAQTLGATLTEVSDAADTWLRQGYSVAETNQLIANSMMLSKLGQLDSASASKALTSAMKGYKVSVSESLNIVDKFTAVDMQAAVSAGDIATAMAETATSADLAGVSMDKLIGYIATVSEVTQDGAESVGNFYKTVFARMGNIKSGQFVDSETGEDLNDVEKVLGKLGISLRDSRDNFRDFGLVLDDVAKSWNTYTNVEQHAIATALAGTRQQEKLITLMSNYGDAIKYANIAADSSGTAQSKYNAAYLDSIDAKLNKLKSSGQELSQTLLDSEIVKSGVDILNALTKGLNTVIGRFDLLSPALGGIGALLIQKITPAVVKLFGTFETYGNKFRSLKTAMETIAKFKSQLKDTGEFEDFAVRAKDNAMDFDWLGEKCGKTGDELKELTKLAFESGDAFGYLKREIQLPEPKFTKEERDDNSKEGIAKRRKAYDEWGKQNDEYIKDVVKTGQAEIDLNHERATANNKLAESQRIVASTTALVLGVATTVLLFLNSFDNSGAKIVTLIAAIGIAVIAAVRIVQLAVKKVKLSLDSLATNPVMAVIMAALTAIIVAIKAIIYLVQAKGKEQVKAKELAENAAKALQEEADALQEIADKAKEASDSIDNLIKEFKELGDSINASDWNDTLISIGAETAKLFANDSLSEIEAINKLLGTTYSYSELINMSALERNNLMREISDASKVQSESAARDAYKKQKEATAKTSNASSNIVVKYDDWKNAGYSAEYAKDRAKEAEDILGNDIIDGLKVERTDGRKQVGIIVNSEDPMKNIEIIQQAINKYEEKFKGRLGDLDEDLIYKALKQSLTENEEAVSKLKESANNLVESIVGGISNDIVIDTKAEDASAELERVITEFKKKLDGDKDLQQAIKDGTITTAQYEQEIEVFLSQHYTDFYNKARGIVEKANVELKSVVDIINEIKDGFDALKAASDDMDELGLISSDSLEKLSELNMLTGEYVEKTESGYKLIDGAVSKYFDKQIDEYQKSISQAELYFKKVREDYENSDTKTIEEYKKVLNAKEMLENATTNAEELLVSISVMERENLVDQYTELLEKHQEELENEIDKQKELADIRKDILSTYQEQLNYQKQLRQKQNSVATLSAELAVANLDTSAAGKARARSISEQLTEAEDDLDEFTLEQAIKEIQTSIESESDEYERFIQERVDEIKESIENASSLNNEELRVSIEKFGGTVASSVSSEVRNALTAVINQAKESSNSDVSNPNSQSENTSSGESSEDTLDDKVERIKGWGIDTKTHAVGANIRLQYKNKTYDVRYARYANNEEWKNLSGMPSDSLQILNGDLFYRRPGKGNSIYKLGETTATGWDHNDINTLTALIETLPNQRTYHTGGFVGDLTKLKSNEEFAKLLKGEFVSTPEQIDNFMNQILPNVVRQSQTGATIEYNSPLIEIKCDKIAEDTLPKLNDIVNKAVDRIKKDMADALGRTGYRKKY